MVLFVSHGTDGPALSAAALARTGKAALHDVAATQRGPLSRLPAAMPVRLVIRNFPPHVDAEAASQYVNRRRRAARRSFCETLYYRRGKPKTKRGVRLGSLYVEGDNDEAIAEQLARAGPPPPPPPPPSSDETQPPPSTIKTSTRAARRRTRGLRSRVSGADATDRRASTWLESPEYSSICAYDPRQLA